MNPHHALISIRPPEDLLRTQSTTIPPLRVFACPLRFSPNTICSLLAEELHRLWSAIFWNITAQPNCNAKLLGNVRYLRTSPETPRCKKGTQREALFILVFHQPFLRLKADSQRHATRGAGFWQRDSCSPCAFEFAQARRIQI